MIIPFQMCGIHREPESAQLILSVSVLYTGVPSSTQARIRPDVNVIFRSR